MKTVLVTGAAGFLGSHLVKHHLEEGDFVIGVDDFCSSSKTSKHFNNLLQHKKFQFFEQDIREHFIDWPKEHKIDLKIDLIYNFACPASPPRYQEQPVHTLLTCTQGVAHMLDLAREHKAVMVHASTSEIYGDPEHTPQKESYRGRVNSYGPRACYDEGKRAAEALCYDYLTKFKTDVRVVRIFNTYGPHMDPNDGRVVSNFVRQMLKGERITIYGDGTQGRSFCYVDDLIRGIVTLGTLKNNQGGPINLGNPNEFSVMDLAIKVGEKVMGAAFSELDCLESMPLPADDPTQRCPDIERARELLNWEPRIQLDEGLDRTIEYFRKVV